MRLHDWLGHTALAALAMIATLGTSSRRAGAAPPSSRCATRGCPPPSLAARGRHDGAGSSSAPGCSRGSSDVTHLESTDCDRAALGRRSGLRRGEQCHQDDRVRTLAARRGPERARHLAALLAMSLSIPFCHRAAAAQSAAAAGAEPRVERVPFPPGGAAGVPTLEPTLGAVLVPALSGRETEPGWELASIDGFHESAPSGHAIAAPPGHYQVWVGSGARSQRTHLDVEVRPGELLRVVPSWGALVVHTVDSDETPFRGPYLLFDLRKRDSYGFGRGAQEELGEEVATWLLRPATRSCRGRPSARAFGGSATARRSPCASSPWCPPWSRRCAVAASRQRRRLAAGGPCAISRASSSPRGTRCRSRRIPTRCAARSPPRRWGAASTRRCARSRRG